MTSRKKIILPLIAIFVVFTGSITAARGLLTKWGMDADVLIVANVLFFIISLVAFYMQKKALYNSNPNVFVRSVMGGMLMKMFVCVVAVVIYRVAAGNSVNKVSVFAAMFLYCFYLAVEVGIISKLNKQKNG